MNNNNAISVKDVTKEYKLYDSHADRVKETFHPFRKKYHRPFNALTDVSFDVDRGEAFGIIGCNGSGKSTLLQIVCGILQPTSGSVHTNGRISALLELGAGFNPEFTGRENVYINGKILGFKDSEIDERFDEIADFADIGEFMDQPLKVYSSGMAVRLAFAVQVCVEPDLLIIDEALSVGDIFFQQKCFARMHEIISGGTTCLFVSHDTAAVQNLCRRAILLNQGEIGFIGDATEVVSRYLSCVGLRPSVSRGKFDNASSKHDRSKDLMKSDEILTHNVIENETNRHGAGGIQIVASRVTDTFGKDHSQVEMMGSLSFYILIRANKDVIEPNVGIDLFDRLGNLVYCTGSTQKNKPLPSMKKGEVICVIFDITFTVQPGQYTYSLAVGEPSDDPNPNIGFIHERVEQLGPLTVNYNPSKMLPFYGIALLPTEVQFYFPSS